jgi:hypothetical protein
MAGLWGSAIAIGAYQAIEYFQPSLIIKATFGYGMGAYLLMPELGLISRMEHIEHTMIRHRAVVQNVPPIIFTAFSIGMALY